MLPRVPEESRTEFVEKMVTCLVTVGGADLPAEEFETFKSRLIELVKGTMQPEEPRNEGSVKYPKSKG